MKESYKIHLQEIYKKKNIQLFRNELHDVIKKEVKAMNIPLLARNEMLAMLELLEIPLEVKSYIKYPPQKYSNKKNIAIIAASATGAILNALLSKIPFVAKGLLSFGGATLVGLLVVGKPQKEEKGVIVETIVTPFEEIISETDKLLEIIRGIITPKKVTLSESYPDILEWYQKAYSACGEFGTDCSEYFKKRIENILYQNGYILHNYDGTNIKMFRTTEIMEILSPTQDLPAITNEVGYILPGKLFVPKNNNN